MSDSNNSVRTERRKDIRFVGSVNGHYTLTSRRNVATGGAQVFACRVQSISPLVAVLSAPVCGEQNEAVTAYLEELGILRGEIIRVSKAVSP